MRHHRPIGADIQQLTAEQYLLPIEELQLSMRAHDCLRRSGLITVAHLLETSEEEYLALRNFGRKSYDELRDRLDELGILPIDPNLDDWEAPPYEEL